MTQAHKLILKLFPKQTYIKLFTKFKTQLGYKNMVLTQNASVGQHSKPPKRNKLL